MKDFQGKIVWIVGASSGIGKALAQELAARGAILALSARRVEALAVASAGLAGAGHMVLPLDAGESDEVAQAAYAIMKKYGRIDSAIFMAASYAPHSKTAHEIEIIHRMLRVNLGGAFNMVDVLRPVFAEQGGGQIALCGSVAGYRGLPFGQPYCAAKAGIINLAESLRVELAPRGVDVKVINPGFVRTPLTDKNDFPMPMMIEAEDAARAIAKGLCRRGFEIHFPKRFTFLMKILRALPPPLYFAVMGHIKLK